MSDQRRCNVALGDQTLTATYQVHGCHLPATEIDPEEWPEIELTGLKTPGGEDVRGLLEFEPVYEHVLEAVNTEERYYNEEPEDVCSD